MSAPVLRPSAYVLLRDAAGRVAVVRTARGDWLPGGGREGTESPEETAIREAREEAGLIVRIDGRIGEAEELVDARDEGVLYRVRGTFLLGRVTGTAPSSEPDHELRWIGVEEARETLVPASHRWALGVATGE